MSTPDQPGAGIASDEIEVQQEAPWLRRFPVRTPTLPPATHTNVYVIGEGSLLVVDPASPYPDEQARLLSYLGGLSRSGHRVTAILLTHHHYDHIAGAGALQRLLHGSVPILAHGATRRRLPLHDRPGGPIAVTRLVSEAEDLPYGPAGVRVLHTPGHAAGHVCLLDLSEGGVVVGDMVASSGTILIDPDDEGDMRLYLHSLGRLRGLMPRRLWPAHGASVADGAGILDFYVRHRLEREARVVAALDTGPGTLQELVPRAYPDVPVALHPLAARSLLAHLRKLQGERRATESGGQWVGR